MEAAPLEPRVARASGAVYRPAAGRTPPVDARPGHTVIPRPMKRVLVLAIAAVVAAAAYLSLGRRPPAADPVAGTPRPDSVWYHESDVALLGSTGRPQLVEFFHPG